MKSKDFFLAVLVVIILLIGYSFWYNFSFPDASWPLRKGERIVIMPGETLSQLIPSSRNGLQKIEILFGKFTLQGEAELHLELRDSTCSTMLAQKTLSRQSFDSEYTHAFVFDRISYSEDETYCFSATFVSNQPIKKDKAPRFFIDKEAIAESYSLSNTSGEKTVGAGPIAIRPGYTNDSFFSNAKEFFDRISQYKPAFLKSWFLITFATLGLGLTFLAVAFIIRSEEDK